MKTRSINTMRSILVVFFTLVFALPSFAQEQVATENKPTFTQVTNSVQDKLQESIDELNGLREQVAAETIPLSRQLSSLEEELRKVREEYQSVSRKFDSRTLDVTNLRREIERREQEANYLSNLLNEYVRNFESRLHVAEVERYQSVLEEARLAIDDSSISDAEVYNRQAAVLVASLDRLDGALGGATFNGIAANENGEVLPGNFYLMGPAGLFASVDKSLVGTAEQRLGSLLPAIIPFENEEFQLAAIRFFDGEKSGAFPFDPTLGNAHKIEDTKETLGEHIGKGGPVMVPILSLAGLAMLVAFLKFIGLTFIRTPSRARLKRLLKAVREQNAEEARAVVKKMNSLDPATDWIKGAIYGAVLTGGVTYLLTMPFAAEIAGLLRFDQSSSFIVFALVGAVVGAIIEMGVRFLGNSKPVGKMLIEGIDHLHEPPELIEEIMYEQVLSTRLRLERFLPFIQITAAAAPLLGLLGTVTGIINTFKLITVFGTGDVKTLSGGISEALITTEFGLIVAIPTLLIHALLARKARGIVNQMEKAGVALVNEVGKTLNPRPEDSQLISGEITHKNLGTVTISPVPTSADGPSDSTPKVKKAGDDEKESPLIESGPAK